MTEHQVPLIKSFRILGLHGYKDIEIDFHGPARIVIAENGSGKTTILSALQAFLDGQFERLARLSFSSIECELVGCNSPLMLRREMLPKGTDPEMESKLRSLSRYADVSHAALRKLIIEHDITQMDSVRALQPFRDIYFQSPMGWEEVVASVSDLREKLLQTQTEDLLALGKEIQSVVGRFEVLYLPTYRRVELPLARDEHEVSAARRIQEGRVFGRGGAHSRSKWADVGIQFGLADVEKRLHQLTAQIQAESNIGYRALSAEIIDELLAGRFAIDPHRAAPQLPDMDSLQRFFSRIESNERRGTRKVDSGPDRRLKAIQDLYTSGQIDSQQNENLRYFLSKLSLVVDQTREMEANIEQFVDKANAYLVQSSDEKILQYDARRMQVVVKNTWTNETVKLDDLSSGEKQVVSLLAHLYLHHRQNIVLIDEPELSLSIDWQKRLLPDVLGSPACKQLLAITHSPFIFDNELDPYAGPLTIRKRKLTQPQ